MRLLLGTNNCEGKQAEAGLDHRGSWPTGRAGLAKAGPARRVLWSKDYLQELSNMAPTCPPCLRPREGGTLGSAVPCSWGRPPGAGQTPRDRPLAALDLTPRSSVASSS